MVNIPAEDLTFQDLVNYSGYDPSYLPGGADYFNALSPVDKIDYINNLSDREPDMYAQQLQDTKSSNALSQQIAAQGSAERAMEFTAAENEKNRLFQRESRKTYFQDLVQSLQAAGMNPALAYQVSSGSLSGNSGSGSAAQMAMSESLSQNISESEKLSKRERDAKIWSQVISGLFGSAESAMRMAGSLAIAGAM